VEVDECDAAAEMTASFVVSGRGATDLIPDLSAALEGVEPREAVANGDERTIHLRIPVVGANGFHAIRDVVEDVVTGKGWTPNRETLTRATRVLVGVLGTGPHRASPYVVAEALDAIASTRHPDVPLSARFDLADIRYALSTLPADRLFPDATPTVRRVVSVLLASDDPLSPAELRERADVSESSYYRHAATMESIDLLERDETDGHVWTVSLEPWWARMSSKNRPDRHVDADAGDGDGGIRARSHPDEMLFELALAMPGDAHRNPVWSTGWGSVEGVDKIAEEVLALAPWVTWVTALVGDVPDAEDAPNEPRVCVVGRAPAAADPAQTSLEVAG
jgi:hypothetical protein